MLVDVQLGTPVIRAWHIDLADHLSRVAEVDVRLRIVKRALNRDERGLKRLVALERLLNGLPRGKLAAADESSVHRYSPSDERPADLVINLSSESITTTQVWTVQFDGHPGESAAAQALRCGRLPVVSVVDSEGVIKAIGRPGSEQPGLLATALSDVMAGTVSLVTGAVLGRQFANPVLDVAASLAPRSYTQIALRRVVSACMYTVYRLLYRAPHWRVGWRRVDGDDVLDLGRQPESGWQDLPDDGFRFYADPVPFEHQGQYYLFLEDYDHRVGRGVISVVEFDLEKGPLGVPRTVLTHDVHLSYPFVLEHDGEIWMIPETSGAGTVELYRAVRFPDEWELYSVLLDGLEASDATPFQHEDQWWLAATVRHGGSYSDSLHLWCAPDLRGPWKSHVGNPVLIDIASARPAGKVVERDGRLLRPTQDCRDGYGVALTVNEIVRLDETVFEERVVAHLEAGGERWPGRRLHTLNRAGDLEVIDGSRMSPRFWKPASSGR